MQVERDRIFQADVFGTELVALDETRHEGYDRFSLAPDKKTSLVGHQPTQAAKVALGQLLELKLRALVDFQIEGIDIPDNWRNIVDDSHLDHGCLFGRLEFPAQIPAHLPAERLVHVVVEIGVVD